MDSHKKLSNYKILHGFGDHNNITSNLLNFRIARFNTFINKPFKNLLPVVFQHLDPGFFINFPILELHLHIKDLLLVRRKFFSHLSVIYLSPQSFDNNLFGPLLHCTVPRVTVESRLVTETIHKLIIQPTMLFQYYRKPKLTPESKQSYIASSPTLFPIFLII